MTALNDCPEWGNIFPELILSQRRCQRWHALTVMSTEAHSSHTSPIHPHLPCLSSSSHSRPHGSPRGRVYACLFPRAQIPHRLVLIDRWALKLARPTHSDSHLRQDQNSSPINSHWQKQDRGAAIWVVIFVFLCNSFLLNVPEKLHSSVLTVQCWNIY